jgi:hypothetical protein
MQGGYGGPPMQGGYGGPPMQQGGGYYPPPPQQAYAQPGREFPLRPILQNHALMDSGVRLVA